MRRGDAALAEATALGLRRLAAVCSCWWRLVAAVCAALLVTPQLAQTAQADDRPRLVRRDWIEVRSPHFLARSMIGEAATVELVRDLELFRRFVLDLASLESDETTIPTDIFVVKSKTDLKRMGVDERDVIGLFVPGLRSNLILVIGDSSFDQHVIQHEYVHFLAGQTSGSSPPLWYSEGFAEFMASTRRDGDEVVFGDVPTLRRRSLERGQWIPFHKIIDRAEAGSLRPGEVSMLYAQSWLLVHYLRLGRSDRDFASDIESYLQQLRVGVPDTTAFETSFGLEVGKLRRTLTSYVNKGDIKSYVLPLARYEQDVEIETRPLASVDMAAILARAILQLDDEGREEEYVEYATRRAPESAAAWAASGMSLARRGRFDEAGSHLEKAQALAPDDPTVALDLARYWLERVERTSPARKQRGQWLSQSRRQAIRASKIDDSIPEIYATYGRNLLVDGRKPEKAVEALEEAARLHPSNLDIRLDLARAQRRMGRSTTAIRLATSVVASGHARAETFDAAIDLIEDTMATCTPELYQDFIEGIGYDVSMQLSESVTGPLVGKVTLSLAVDASRGLADVEAVKFSSERFRDQTLDAAHEASPFSSVSNVHLSCFGGAPHRVSLQINQPHRCDRALRDSYVGEVIVALNVALHEPEQLDRPGSGRIVMRFGIGADGSVEERSLVREVSPALEAKLDDVIQAFEPVGPRPGSDACWSTPVIGSFDVIGSDSEIDQ